MAMSSDEARVPMTRIPYRDLRVRDPLLKMELLEAVGRVLDHRRLVRGPEHEQFEAEMARHCRRQHAVGVGSGTDALYLALRALDIGPGDEVMTTALSRVATASAIVLTGATPVFVDIGDDLNIDVELIERPSRCGRKRSCRSTSRVRCATCAGFWTWHGDGVCSS